MSLLTPEQLEESRRRQVENLLAKQAKGKTLTAAEQRTIAAAASSHAVTTSNYVTSYDALAKELGITRMGLHKVCQRFPSEFPTPKPDGRHDVALWLEFFAKHNIKGAAEGVPLTDISDEAEDVESGPVTVQEWKAEEIKLKCAKLNLENARVSGTLVYAADVERGVSVLVQSFRQALNNMPDRLAGKIVGITDYHEAVEITQEEVNVILRTLQRCDFLQGFEVAKEAQALPTFDDEPEAVEAPVKRKAGRPKGKR